MSARPDLCGGHHASDVPTAINRYGCSTPVRATKIESSMKLLWCWRCKAEMPMLDDDEYRQVMSFRPTTVGTLQTRFKSMLAEYERITGFRETNPNAVFHHRLSDYGPPCRHCGKPLRTPQARVCGSCMKPVSC
jgi:hypothetical protein